MADTVLAMRADLGAPLARTVCATDAMGANDCDHGGFGIVASLASQETVEACFEDGLEPGFTVCKLDGTQGGMKRPDRALQANVPFTQVPPSIIENTWYPIKWGRWRATDHITLGEARTVVQLMSIVTRDPRSHRHKIISLQDNRPVAGSFAKGRSTAPTLNRACRQRASYALAADLQVLLPWIQSKLMPADGLSRDIEGDAIDAPFEGPRVVTAATDTVKPQG